MHFPKLLSAFLTAGLLMGCDDTLAVAPIQLNPEITLGSIEVAPLVSIIAIGGTQQISVVATRSLTGAALGSPDSVRYVLVNPADTLRVRVSPTGVVTGVAVTSTPVQINVFAFTGDAARADQSLVQVTASAITGLTLSIQPTAPDSAKLAQGTAKTIRPVLRNPSTGQSVTNPAMRYVVKGADTKRVGVYRPSIVIPGGVELQPRVVPTPRPTANQIVPWVGEGSAWIYGSVTAFGVELRDSVLYTLSYPFTFTYSVRIFNLRLASDQTNSVITLAPGATITFSNGVSATNPMTLSYTFSDPSVALAASPASTTGGASGNVAPISGAQTSRRRFSTLGSYQWTATAGGASAPWAGQTVTGTIVIK